MSDLIGFFDSGLGGISVLHEARRVMPTIAWPQPPLSFQVRVTPLFSFARQPPPVSLTVGKSGSSWQTSAAHGKNGDLRGGSRIFDQMQPPGLRPVDRIRKIQSVLTQ